MPHHSLDLTIKDAESAAEAVKQFLDGIEQPLVSIELSAQDWLWSFYGFYQVTRLDRDLLATKIIKRIIAVPFGKVRLVARYAAKA
jgi:hypothetical protein